MEANTLILFSLGLILATLSFIIFEAIRLALKEKQFNKKVEKESKKAPKDTWDALKN